MGTIKVKEHPLYAELVNAGITLPRSIRNAKCSESEEFNPNNVGVGAHNLLSLNGVEGLEDIFRGIHKQLEAYGFLNLVGYYIITDHIREDMMDTSEDETPNLMLSPGYAKHLIQEHDMDPYRTLVEMWANAWANYAYKAMGHDTILYPGDLVVGDAVWYRETNEALEDEVKAGEYAKALQMYTDYVNSTVTDCGILRLFNKVKEGIPEATDPETEEDGDPFISFLGDLLGGVSGKRRQVTRIVMGDGDDDKDIPDFIKNLMKN